jgi:hypothetical protein
MKTVIVTMPMKAQLERLKYPVAGNSAIEYDGEVYFPINGVLSRILQPQEKVKTIFIVTHGGDDKGFANMELFLNEFNEINAAKGAHITHEAIELRFEPTKKEFDKLIRQLIDFIESGTEVITDFTFGSKPFPFVLLCALNFVESYKNVTILYLIYGKVDFIKGKVCNPCVYDITSVYYLQKLIGSIGDYNVDTALKMLDDFFSL